MLISQKQVQKEELVKNAVFFNYSLAVYYSYTFKQKAIFIYFFRIV